MSQTRVSPGVIARHLTMDLLVPGARTAVAVRTVWSYSEHNPYSLRICFLTGDTEVVWVFARDLIRDSVAGRAGQGDVSAWTEPGLAGPSLRLRLTSPASSADLRIARSQVDPFLDLTYARVPAGTEASQLDFDSALNRLLA